MENPETKRLADKFCKSLLIKKNIFLSYAKDSFSFLKGSSNPLAVRI
jgi:hypothetical protein